jgi:putative SOS response-associated peptidase YedK
MCGRFTLFLDPGELREELDLGDFKFEPARRYNIAPSQPVAVVRDGITRDVELFRWGLVPSWAKDISIGDKMINARSETLLEKPSFRNAFARRRCLILADGFYEWQAPASGKGHKQPYFFQLTDGKPFAFAGLWEVWHSPEGDVLNSCTIITCEPNEVVKPVHGRMPVILPKPAYPAWLSAQTPLEAAQQLLAPFPAEWMTARPVGFAVNKPEFDAPECVAQLML